MTLFTKPDCQKCDYIKEHVNLKELGVKVELLTPQNVDALAHLAWHEIVGTAETSLPILVLNDNTAITGAIKIKNYLLGICPYCLGDGCFAEHDLPQNHDHETGECISCPIQVPCEKCQATGRIHKEEK
jgi:hypothetical protein